MVSKIGQYMADHRAETEQGYLHHWNIDYRRWCQGAQDTNEELDLYHLLRGCGHLRSHHVYCLLGQAIEC